MPDKEKNGGAVAPQVNIAAALSGLAALGTAAQQQIAAQNAAAGLERLDEAKVPGGEYIGADGLKHDAHGNVFDNKGEVKRFASLTPATLVQSAGTDVELDALEALIAKRREALAAEAEEKKAGPRSKRAEPSKEKPQGANLAGDDEDEALGQDYDGMSREELEAAVKSRGITVKGSGSNGNVLKSDIVGALQKADGR